MLQKQDLLMKHRYYAHWFKQAWHSLICITRKSQKSFLGGKAISQPPHYRNVLNCLQQYRPEQFVPTDYSQKKVYFYRWFQLNKTKLTLLLSNNVDFSMNSLCKPSLFKVLKGILKHHLTRPRSWHSHFQFASEDNNNVHSMFGTKCKKAYLELCRACGVLACSCVWGE